MRGAVRETLRSPATTQSATMSEMDKKDKTYGLRTFALFGDVAALICTFLSPSDSYAALVIFRELAGTSVIVHRRRRVIAETRARCRSTTDFTFVNGLLHSVNDEPASNWRLWMADREDCQERRWYRNGLLHRDGDKPAMIYRDKLSWLTNGQYRNDHRPSTATPREITWQLRTHVNGHPDGVLHRMGDLPAVITNEVVKWMKFGRGHKRDNDLPGMIWFDGTMAWVGRDAERPDAERPYLMYAQSGQMLWQSKCMVPPDETDVDAFNAYKAQFLSFYPIRLVDRVAIQLFLGFLKPSDFPVDD